MFAPQKPGIIFMTEKQVVNNSRKDGHKKKKIRYKRMEIQC